MDLKEFAKVAVIRSLLSRGVDAGLRRQQTWSNLARATSGVDAAHLAKVKKAAGKMHKTWGQLSRLKQKTGRNLTGEFMSRGREID